MSKRVDPAKTLIPDTGATAGDLLLQEQATRADAVATRPSAVKITGPRDDTNWEPGVALDALAPIGPTPPTVAATSGTALLGTIVGTDGDDSIVGTNDADTIYARAGNIPPLRAGWSHPAGRRQRVRHRELRRLGPVVI